MSKVKAKTICPSCGHDKSYRENGKRWCMKCGTRISPYPKNWDKPNAGTIGHAIETSHEFDGVCCGACNSGKMKFEQEYSDLYVDAEFYQCDDCDGIFPVIESFVAGKNFREIDFSDRQ